MNKESRTINARKNVISSFINKIVLLILAFICRKVFIHFIGVEYLGISGLFSNILTLLSVAELGLGTAMNVMLYKPIVDNDIKRLSSVLYYFKKLYNYISILVLVIGLGLMPFLRYIVNLKDDIPNLYLYYFVLLISTVGSYLFVYKGSIIRADQKSYLINRVELFTTIGITVLKILLIIVFKNYLFYLIVELIRVIAHNLIVSHIADKHYPFIKKHEELSNDEKRKINKDAFSAFVYKFSKTIINSTDNILISILIGTITVGLYSNYYMITHTLESFIALFFSALTSSIGNMIAKESNEKSYFIFKVIQMISFWISAFCTISMFFLFQDFIVMWLGNDMLLDSLTLFSIVLCFFININMRPIISFREGTGMYNKVAWINIIAAVINIVLSIVLCKALGLSGIFFATSISKLVTYFWFEPVVLFRTNFKKNPLHFFLAQVFNLLLAIISFALCYFICNLFELTNVWIWLIKALICFSVVSAIYFVFYFKKEEFSYIWTIVHNLLKKRRSNYD